MQRKTFVVSWMDQTVTKHAWNASIRAIEQIIRAIARAEGQHYTLTDYESFTTPEYPKDHIRGHRTWTGDNGRVITFAITTR